MTHLHFQGHYHTTRRARRATSALLALLALPLAAAVPPALEWNAELTVPQMARREIFRGETVPLAANLLYRGLPWSPPAASAAFCWQTNGMGAGWWSVPAAVSSNRVEVSVTPAMDPGADCDAFFRVEASDGVARELAGFQEQVARKKEDAIRKRLDEARRVAALTAGELVERKKGEKDKEKAEADDAKRAARLEAREGRGGQAVW